MARETLFLVFTLTVLAVATLAFGADSPVWSLAVSLLFMGAAGASYLCLPGRTGHNTVTALLTLAWAGVAVGQWAAAAGQSGPDILTLGGGLGAFILGRQLSVSPDRALHTLSASVMVGGGLAMASFLAFVADPGSVWGQAKLYHVQRLTGPFLSANTAATLFAVMAVLGLGLTTRAVRGATSITEALEKVGEKAVLPALATLFAGTCLMLTGSRAGVAVGGGGLLIVLLWGLSGQRLGRVMFGAVFVLGMALVAGDSLFGRVAEATLSDNGRLVLWSASWAAFLDAPLFGHGLGSFQTAMLAEATAETASTLVVQGAAHNLLLQWLAQTGLWGGAFGVLSMGAVGRSIFRGLRTRRRQRGELKAGIVALGVVLAHGVFDYALEITAIFLWSAWIAGIATGIADRGAAPSDRPGSRVFV